MDIVRIQVSPTTGRTRYSVKPRLLLLAFSWLFLPAAGSGQVLQGYVVEDSIRTGVDGATVTIFIDDLPVGASIADSEGWFSFQLPDSGTYRLEAQRLGYSRVRSQALFLSRRDTLTVEVFLRTEAIALEPLVVTAGRGRGSSNFYRRQESWGKGVFLTPAVVDSIDPRHPADVLRNQEKTWLSWTQGRWKLIPRIKTSLGWGCVEYVLDGRRIDPGLWGPVWEESPLSWISGEDVVAVEYYRYVGEAPPELRRFARDCGLLVFWTAVGW